MITADDEMRLRVMMKVQKPRSQEGGTQPNRQRADLPVFWMGAPAEHYASSTAFKMQRKPYRGQFS